MDEKELFAAWKSDDTKESLVFNSNKGKYSDIAKAKSGGLFARIRKNMIIESVLGVIFCTGLPFLFLSDRLFFWLSIALALVIVGLMVIIYGGYLRQMKQINESSILTSLEKKLKILRTYLKQLHYYNYILGPIGFAFGYMYPFMESDLSDTKLLIKALIGIPFMLWMLWFTKKYIHALYGKHLVALEKLYDDMVKDA